MDDKFLLNSLQDRLKKLRNLEKEVESLRMQAPPEVEIYHMLVEELGVPAGGSLVETIEAMRSQLIKKDKMIEDLRRELSSKSSV